MVSEGLVQGHMAPLLLSHGEAEHQVREEQSCSPHGGPEAEPGGGPGQNIVP
jgi:hypothetical protein